MAARLAGHVLANWDEMAGCPALDPEAIRHAIENVVTDRHTTDEVVPDRRLRTPVNVLVDPDNGRDVDPNGARLILVLAETADTDAGPVCRSVHSTPVCRCVLAGLSLAAANHHRAPVRPEHRPRTVRRAIDAIERHPEQPFTAAILARIAGVSLRTLQQGFQQHVGVSPMAYLRQVRLARAHADLQESDPGSTTVAAIAHRWSFYHLGRFAAAYRARYHTTPSNTLHN
jgi:AraC-like DNA-binding protein